MPTASKEVAVVEFQRFADLMDLDLDSSNMTDDDNEQAEKLRVTITNAIQTGHVTINAIGEPTINLKVKTDTVETVTFHEPDGSTLMSIDRAKKGSGDVSKMFSLMTNMTGLSEGSFAPMKQRDLKVAQAIALMLLG